MVETVHCVVGATDIALDGVVVMVHWLDGVVVTVHCVDGITAPMTPVLVLLFTLIAEVGVTLAVIWLEGVVLTVHWLDGVVVTVH